jgi:MYXO-CTERM domain-containing protein
MHNPRFRLITALAGATMCLFAATAYGQTPTTTGTAGAGTPGASSDYNSSAATQPVVPSTTTAQPGSRTGAATTTTGTTTDNSVTTAPVDNTVPATDTGRRGFNWGLLGLLGLLGLFRGRSTEVRRDTYATTTPGTRTVGTGTAYDDRTGTAVPRAASGTSSSGSSGNGGTMGDAGSRR